MFIGICGAICSGKHTIAAFLIREHGFQLLQLVPSQATSAIAPPLARTPDGSEKSNGNQLGNQAMMFETAEAMLEYATRHYDKDFVTTTIPDERTLDLFAQRPFFMLVSVDAPVGVRYERWKARNCMKRRVGCVLVRSHRVIATGYNGVAKGMTNCSSGGCPRCNGGTESGAGLQTCLCLHAEENALLEAGRERVGRGSTLYCDTCPCLTCAIKIVQVGIREVTYWSTSTK
ncbi:hypothetical protein BJ508DRAFT_369562 [Ascobolus immersus RN42]|uniref:dCMP deaminase n=1 Tax=Ascobolus immersus RN42 TaxID=1160509 RepID=A0A3N4IDQ8_ASCIM|nr:hypothetical protein BJ508DRAFT_369562 [Ascobolus immersus RN42]